MKASDIMTFGAATVRESDTALQAIELLVDHCISALPVLDGAGKLKGILTERDFLRAEAIRPAELLAMPSEARRQELAKLRVDEIMTQTCVTIGPDTSLGDALDVMDRRALKRLPVVSEGKVVGLVSRSDILRALVEDK